MRADQAAEVLDAADRRSGVALQVGDQPADVLVRDHLRGHHDEHVHGPAAQGEDELLDVGSARRQVDHQAIRPVPVGVGDQPPHEQLGEAGVHAEALALADQERGRGDLDAVPCRRPAAATLPCPGAPKTVS